MPTNRQKISFLALIFTGILCFLCLAYIFHKRPDDSLSTVLAVENNGVVTKWGALPCLPPQKPLVLPSPSIAAAAETAATSVTQPTVAQPTLSAKPTCLYLVRVPVFKAPPEAIGVVDTDRLLAVLPPTSNSPEARANAISDIQRATTACARTHECGVVLDISGNSTDGYPFVLSAVETLDLTGEVIQQLTR